MKTLSQLIQVSLQKLFYAHSQCLDTIVDIFILDITADLHPYFSRHSIPLFHISLVSALQSKFHQHSVVLDGPWPVSKWHMLSYLFPDLFLKHFLSLSLRMFLNVNCFTCWIITLLGQYYFQRNITTNTNTNRIYIVQLTNCPGACSRKYRTEQKNTKWITTSLHSLYLKLYDNAYSESKHSLCHYSLDSFAIHCTAQMTLNDQMTDKVHKHSVVLRHT